MRLSVVVGAVLAANLVHLGIILGAPLAVFWDLPTAILVVFLSFAFLLQAHGMAGLKTTLQAARCWVGMDKLPPEGLGDACCVVETGAKATIRSAHIPMLIGVIQILQYNHGDDPSFFMPPDEAIAPAIAVCLLSYFYALGINFVFWGPLGRWLTQHTQAKATDTSAGVVDPTV